MSSNGVPGTMERILRLMADKKASDVYLSANSPALIKIDGVVAPTIRIKPRLSLIHI